MLAGERHAARPVVLVLLFYFAASPARSSRRARGDRDGLGGRPAAATGHGGRKDSEGEDEVEEGDGAGEHLG